MDTYTLIVLAALFISFVSLCIAIIATINYKKLYRAYDLFMRGRDAESLEDLVTEEKDAIISLQEQMDYQKDSMRVMNRTLRSAYQKTGIVRYDAFEGMGGKMSFALALLDYTNSGVVINCMHAKEGCFLYIKDIDAGTTDTPLGTEEKMALEKALGYIND